MDPYISAARRLLRAEMARISAADAALRDGDYGDVVASLGWRLESTLGQQAARSRIAARAIKLARKEGLLDGDSTPTRAWSAWTR